MDFKGIDIRAVNMLPGQLIVNERRQGPAVRPVDKSERPKLRSRRRRKRQGEGNGLSVVTKEEEARYAYDTVADFLARNKELHAQLKRLEDEDSYVVLIKNRSTNEILCQIPIEEVISGAFFDRNRPYGLLVDRTA